MSDHERIDELLAGHVLRALESEDAAEAERLLAEHVPGCPTCRSTLDELQETASDLALAAAPAIPPDLLLTRLHREIRETSWVRRRSVGSWIWMTAAVAVVGLTVWNAVLHSRLSNEVDTKKRIATAVGVLSEPGFRTVSFDTTRPLASHMRAAFRPGDARVVLYGSDIPEPHPGDVYRLWLGKHGRFVSRGTFVPEEGLVVLMFPIDLSRYDEILITEERAGAASTRPSGQRRWSATVE
jgi:anti-sigma-K factor RskA